MANVTDAEIMTGFSPTLGPVNEETKVEDAEVKNADAEAPVESASEETQPATEQPTPAAEERDVFLDGRAYKAPKDIADAFTREINRRDGARGGELQQLRERLARLEGASTTQPKEPESESPKEPDPDLLIENPQEYQKQMLAYIDQREQTRLEGVTKQYQEAEAAKEQQAARNAAWAAHCERFYSLPENKILVGNKDIVDLVLEQNKEIIHPLPIDEGFALLSQLAKERLAKVTGVVPEARARTQQPPHLEGSVRRDTPKVVSDKDTGPRSLTQALKDRRRAAEAAFSKGSQSRPST